MTIRDNFLPILDRWRGRLNTRFDLRRYDVSIVVTTWTGGVYPGAPGSTKTQVVTPLYVDGHRPKVEQLSQKDIIASGGLYQDQDLRVGPLTPSFASGAGGVDPSVFDPAAGGSNVEIAFLLVGTGLPAAGALYKKVGQTIVPGNFRYELILRKTADQSA